MPAYQCLSCKLEFLAREAFWKCPNPRCSQAVELNLPPNVQPEIRRIDRPESQISIILQGGRLYERKNGQLVLIAKPPMVPVETPATVPAATA